jgi:hypothetical protein
MRNMDERITQRFRMRLIMLTIERRVPVIRVE